MYGTHPHAGKSYVASLMVTHTPTTVLSVMGMLSLAHSVRNGALGGERHGSVKLYRIVQEPIIVSFVRYGAKRRSFAAILSKVAEPEFFLDGAAQSNTNESPAPIFESGALTGR